MALSMQAAKKKGIPFVVLDRPNPIGGEIVEGALVEPKFKSFVGFYPIPARVVEIYPEWRGYEVILVKGRYVIVRPRTHEIVYIIEG